MLTGGQFYDVLCAVVPLHVALFLGYGSLKWWGVVTPEQSSGINRFNGLVAIPALIFQILAFNNPYTMNNRLIAAYSLSNSLILGVLFTWAWFAKAGSIDWVITLFQLSMMPNVIIVGLPVLSPLYSVTTQGIAAIFIGEVLWLNAVLFLYEIRAARLKYTEKVELPVLLELAVAPADVTTDTHTGPNETPQYGVSRCESNAPQNGLVGLTTDGEHDDCCIKMNAGAVVDNIAKKVAHQAGTEADHQSSKTSEPSGSLGGEIKENERPIQGRGRESRAGKMKMKAVAIRVFLNMMQLPLTYSALLGIIYSLIASRYGFAAPRLFKNSLDIISRISLGLTMYTIGLFMAGQTHIFTSWWVTLYGAFCRFVVGPASMGLATFALGLRGDTLRFAFLQAALPQAVICFVFAKEHNLHTDVFSTAVSIQTLVFLPIMLAYYTLIGL